MTDPDGLRRFLVELGVPEESLQDVINSGGQTWDTKQLQEEFEVLGFAAPFVVVKRKADQVKGSLMFTHYPRFYFGFMPENQEALF